MGKKRKCCSLAFFPFPTKFSKPFYRVVQSQDCVVKDYKNICRWKLKVAQITTSVFYMYMVKIMVRKAGNAGYQQFLLFQQNFKKRSSLGSLTLYFICQFWALQIQQKTDMMSKSWTNGDTVIWLSRKHCGKRRNCSLRAISSFPKMFSKAVYCWWVKMSIWVWSWDQL